MLLLSGLLVAAELDWAALNAEMSPSVAHLARLDPLGREVGNGTGFVVGAPCQIATNHHVVAGAGALVARFPNGASFPILGVVAEDPIQDLAIVVAEGICPPPLRLLASPEHDPAQPDPARPDPAQPADPVSVGTAVAVIGSPLGLHGSVSVGTIAARREALEDRAGEWLQITAPISPGSSGSPVFLPDGRVIGVVTMLLVHGQNINFASPVRHLEALLHTLGPDPAVRALGAGTDLVQVAQSLGFILLIVAGWAFVATRPAHGRR